MGERTKGVPGKCTQEQKCEGKAGGWTINVEGTKEQSVAEGEMLGEG